MDIPTRKIEFIQKFLSLNKEKDIAQLEVILKMIEESEADFKPFSVDELERRIDQSERDFNLGKFKKTSELLEKY